MMKGRKRGGPSPSSRKGVAKKSSSFPKVSEEFAERRKDAVFKATRAERRALFKQKAAAAERRRQHSSEGLKQKRASAKKEQGDLKVLSPRGSSKISSRSSLKTPSKSSLKKSDKLKDVDQSFDLVALDDEGGEKRRKEEWKDQQERLLKSKLANLEKKKKKKIIVKGPHALPEQGEVVPAIPTEGPDGTLAKGFGSAFTTIVSQGITNTQKLGLPLGPSLMVDPDIEATSRQQDLQVKAARALSAAKRRARDARHLQPHPLDRPRESRLKSVATNGVLKLFNTIMEFRRKGLTSVDDYRKKKGAK